VTTPLTAFAAHEQRLLDRVGELAVGFVPLPDPTVSVIPIRDILGLRATRSQLLAFDNTLLRARHRGRAP
jgi:hypothetical protein